jgi:hypothetical protein
VLKRLAGGAFRGEKVVSRVMCKSACARVVVMARG